MHTFAVSFTLMTRFTLIISREVVGRTSKRIGNLLSNFISVIIYFMFFFAIVTTHPQTL